MPRQQPTTSLPSKNPFTPTTTPKTTTPCRAFVRLPSTTSSGGAVATTEDNAASDYMSIMTNFGEQEGQAERDRLQREKEAADMQAMLERKLKLVDVLER